MSSDAGSVGATVERLSDVHSDQSIVDNVPGSLGRSVLAAASEAFSGFVSSGVVSVL